MRRAAQRFLEDSISDALVKGFLKSGDAATIDLGTVEGDQCTVVIRKRSGTTGGSMEVDIEDASGGVGSAKAKTRINLNRTSAYSALRATQVEVNSVR